MSSRLFALIALFALVACRGSDPQPLVFLTGEQFNTVSSIVVGGGSSEFVGYTRPGFVRLLRYDQGSPGQVALVGDIDLWATGDVSVMAIAGTVAILGSSTHATLVDLTSPLLASKTVPLSMLPDALALDGRWLLTASGNTLTLTDIEQVSPPASAVVTSAVTALVATQGSFLAFTRSGYVHVTPDATAPTFDAVQNPIIRNFQSAFADGAEALVAGPAVSVGRSRVVRLDLRSPGAPAMIRSYEVNGDFGFFAWDGASTSVVAIAGGWGHTVTEGYVVREENGSFTSFGIPLPERSDTANPIAAHANLLFAVGQDGFGVYAIR
jgi:hypothetical protein